MITDKEIVKKKFGKSIYTYDANAIAQQKIVDRLVEIIDGYYPHQPERILEIGCGTGKLTKEVVSRYKKADYSLNDINPQIMGFIPFIISDISYSLLVGDAENINYPGNQDLIVSSSTYQWLSNLPSFLQKMKVSMSQNGYMFFSTFGKSTLEEIRTLNGTGLNYYSLPELKSILEAEFTVLYLSEEQIILHFPSPVDVLKHLRATGVNGGFSEVWSKHMLDLFCEKYNAFFKNDKGVTLTYQPIYAGVKKKETE